MFRCIVIDDEQYAVEGLTRYIQQIENLQLITTYTDPVQALTSIKSEDKIDFIFLDIEMPKLNGLELAEVLRKKTRYLIFTTGHIIHAATAFDLRADHYLLKPISFAKFALTIREILKDEIIQLEKTPIKKQFQFIKTGQKNTYHSIKPNTITHIIAAKNYVIIYTDSENRQLVTYIGMNQVESLLCSTEFIRVNKSTIVAKYAIDKVEGNTVTLKNGRTFILGITFKNAFKEFLDEHILKFSLKKFE